MAKSQESDLDKGAAAEEAIAEYFRDLGSYALRSVPMSEGKQHVSDIDIWVYTRASVHARYLSIVDVKNRKRARGFERAIWVKGLQSAIGANEAIIASTAATESVEPFARKLGVRVLSRNTIGAILKRYGGQATRLSREELNGRWKTISVRGPRSARSIVDSALEELSRGITFAALNSWIDDAAELFTVAVDREREPADLWRAAYLLLSLVALGGDYLGRDLSFSEPDVRLEWFRNGLMFGTADRDAGRGYLRFAETLVTEHLDQTGAAAAAIRAGFQRDLERLPLGGFAEVFARPAAGRELLEAAVALEKAAFAVKLVRASELGPEARTLLGLLFDYAGLKRSAFLGAERRVVGVRRPPEADREPAQNVLPLSSNRTDEEDSSD